jgi:LuxR family transcriptional regulator, maltose regulon positive regulatory protein
VVPRPPAAVLRGRLFNRLDVGSEGLLTLLTGPAGAGKTVLMSTWLSERPHADPVVWISMQPSDGRPVRFWGELIRRLRDIFDEPLGSLPDPDDGLSDDFGSRFAAGAEGLPEPVLVVLDDFEQAQSRALADSFDLFLRGRQQRLRLLIASRHDPSVALQRLRLEGRLTELRATDLVMTPEESRELLASAGVALTDEDAEVLHERTEGWVAGLSLAALSLKDHPDPTRFVRTFAGDERPVGDYLIEEVLQRQPSQLRDFLLRTSVVDVLEPGLTEELTGRADGMHTLEQLRRSNAFLVPTDQRERRYRYHPLFKELLRSQLRYQTPEAYALEHRRAARWFAGAGRPAEAVWHAMAAGDQQMAQALVAQQWLTLIEQGHSRDLLRWVRSLGGQAVSTTPELALAGAAAELDEGDLDAARSYLQIADDHAGAVPTKLRARFTVSRAIVTMLECRTRGDLEATRDAAHKVLVSWSASDTDQLSRGVAQLHLGVAECWLGDPMGGRRRLERVLESSRGAANDGLTLDCLGQLALLAVVDGRLRDAARLGRWALQIAAKHGWDERPVAVAAYLALAITHLQWADVEESGRLLDQALAATQRSRGAMASLVELVHGVRTGGHDPVQGLRIARAARHEIDASELPDSLAAIAALMETLLVIDSGDLEPARLTLATEPWTALVPLEAAVARARIALADADPSESLRELQPWLADSSTVRYLGSRIQALGLASLAHSLMHNDTVALDALEEALALAQPEGFRLPLILLGAPLRAMLRRRIRAGTAHRSLAGELIQRLDGDDAPELDAGSLVLLDPLSDREEAVLRYLPTVMSKAEIAAELFVSVNTVKTHTKNIYRKLGVATRNDAVRRAKQLNLV